MALIAVPAGRKHHFSPPHLFYFVRSRLHTAGIIKLGLFWSPDECLSRQCLFCSNHSPRHSIKRQSVLKTHSHPLQGAPWRLHTARGDSCGKELQSHRSSSSWSLTSASTVFILGMTDIQTSHFSWYQRKLWYSGNKATNRRCHSRGWGGM